MLLYEIILIVLAHPIIAWMVTFYEMGGSPTHQNLQIFAFEYFVNLAAMIIGSILLAIFYVVTKPYQAEFVNRMRKYASFDP